MMRRTRLWIAGGLLAVGLLTGCEPSAYGDNTETQVAVYLTETVPTIQAGGNFPSRTPEGAGGEAAPAPDVSGVPTQPPRAPTEEDVRVARVVDGDTLELEDGRKVRLIGINTPESGQPFYNEAMVFTANLVEGRVVSLGYDAQRADEYGRALAYVYVGDVFVNLEIVRGGYANVYTVPPNVYYAQAFLDAEREARNNTRGLWQQSAVPLNITALNPDAEGDDNVNPNGEWVEITNEGTAPQDLTGFTLKDEANHIFSFPQMTLVAGASVRLYSGVGFNTTDMLYWGLSNDSVWNNDGDTAYLRDPSGAIVDTFTY